MSDAAYLHDRDADHLRLLAIFHYVVGAMKILFSSLFIIHVVMGIVLYMNPDVFPTKPPLPVGPATVERVQVRAPGDDGPNAEVDVEPEAPVPVEAVPAVRTQEFPRELFLLFSVFGGIAILIGWTFGILTIVSGRCIAKRKARTFSLVIAGLNCLAVPFGTALGVCTIIVLVRDSVQRIYDEAHAARAAAAYDPMKF